MAVTYYEHPNQLHSRAIRTDYTIRVDTSTDSIVYDLIDRANDEHYDAGSQPVTVKDVDWNDLIEYLKPLVSLEGDDPLIAENVWYQLRTFGMALAEQVLSRDLRVLAAQWHPNTIVLISGQEAWIPWELIHDGDDFWGRKFLLYRKPRMPPGMRYDGAGSDSSPTVSDTPKKRLHVIGGGLKHYQSRAEQLFSDTIYAGLTTSEFARHTENASIIHLTCHGHRHGKRISLQIGHDNNLPHYLFEPTNVHGLQNILHSLVFVNACASATPTPFLGQEHSQSFPWEFYKKGVACFIGTLGTVPIKYAIDFAEQFYEKFLNGATVAEALGYARENAPLHTPFWLFYSLYGDPFVTLNDIHKEK
jgi:hypothetical protein